MLLSSLLTIGGIFMAIIIVGLILVLIAILIPLSTGVMSDMALDAVDGKKIDMRKSLNRACSRILDLILLMFLIFIIALVASIIPVIGPTIVVTLFAPAPLLVIMNRSFGDALTESYRIIIDAWDVDRNFVIVIFLIHLFSKITTGSLGIIIDIITIPYSYILIALYLRRYLEIR